MPNLSLFESVPILLNQIKNCDDSRKNKTVTMKLWTLKPYAYDYEHLPMTMNIFLWLWTLPMTMNIVYDCDYDYEDYFLD